MFFKLFLMKLDHFFTERLNHWIGQLKYGKEIDFSIPNLKRGGYRQTVRIMLAIRQVF